MPFITINKFNGGLADSKYSGIAGSFANGYGIDIHSEIGVLQSQQALAKDSGATVDGLIVCGFAGSDGNTYYGDENGAVYRRTADGVWSEEIDLGARVCGMGEFNGYFYAATHNTLYRIVIEDGIGSLASYQTWTDNEIDNLWHPMLQAPSGQFCIGAGQYISTIDSADAWNSQALDLPLDWSIKTLAAFGDYLLIGASYNVDTINKCGLYPWDGTADSFITPKFLNEPTIDACLVDGSMAMILAGNTGNIYVYDGANFTDLKKIPGNYSPSSELQFYPNALVNNNGIYLFGVSAKIGGPCNMGVYSWGSQNKNQFKVLSNDYVVSTGTQQLVKIGCILVVGTDIFVAWEDTGTYGVDKLDFTTKFNNSVYETIVIGKGYPENVYSRFIIDFEPLASGCSVTLKYKTEADSNWQSFTNQSGTTSTAGVTNLKIDEEVRATTLQLQLTLGISSNYTPKIKQLIVKADATKEF